MFLWTMVLYFLAQSLVVNNWPLSYWITIPSPANSLPVGVFLGHFPAFPVFCCSCPNMSEMCWWHHIHNKHIYKNVWSWKRKTLNLVFVLFNCIIVRINTFPHSVVCFYLVCKLFGNRGCKRSVTCVSLLSLLLLKLSSETQNSTDVTHYFLTALCLWIKFHLLDCSLQDLFRKWKSQFQSMWCNVLLHCSVIINARIWVCKHC